MIPPEVVPYLNLALNLVTMMVVAALAVWLRRSHISTVALKAQLLGMIMTLSLTINGHAKKGDRPGGPSDSDGQ